MITAMCGKIFTKNCRCQKSQPADFPNCSLAPSYFSLIWELKKPLWINAPFLISEKFLIFDPTIEMKQWLSIQSEKNFNEGFRKGEKRWEKGIALNMTLKRSFKYILKIKFMSQLFPNDDKKFRYNIYVYCTVD